MFLKNRNAADDNASPPYQLLLPYEDETVENTIDFYSVGYHRIYINAVVTSVVIATDKAMLKGAQRKMFCCALFVRSLRRVWLSGEQGGGKCCQYPMLPISIFNSKPATRNLYSNSQLELFPLATFNRSTAPHASKRRRIESLRLDNHPCPSADEFVELFRVPVRETETTVRLRSSYAFRERGAVYSIARD